MTLENFAAWASYSFFVFFFFAFNSYIYIYIYKIFDVLSESQHLNGVLSGFVYFFPLIVGHTD